MPIQLNTPLQCLPGVGTGRAKSLAKANLNTVEDLLRYKPFRYEDRTNFKLIRDLRADEEVVVQGKVTAAGKHTSAVKRVRIFEAVVADGSGQLRLTFFNQPYLEGVLKSGKQVIVFGTTRFDDYSHSLTMVNPDFELMEDDRQESLHAGRIVPVYRKVGRLTAKLLRQLVFEALNGLEERIPDPLPEALVGRYGFPDRRESFQQVHFPVCPADASRQAFLQDLAASRSPAYERFIYEEFYLFQMGLQLLRRQRRSQVKQRRIRITDQVRRTIKSILPFHPTQAQKRVLKEIADDLSGPHAMSRLLQGDVGSGKTIVALQAMVVVMENGYQAALMAPTEILAEQHAKGIRRLLEGTPYRSVFLSSSVKGKARREALEQIRSGEAQMVIGTHALIQKKVEFADLGMIVVDEQHRFGVMQRSELMRKSDQPDVLVMTATPIPRSLALTLYGDLDLSVLDEMPPGRQPVQTLLRTDKGRREVYEALHRQLDQGRQIYVVYPLIEESEKMDLKAATEMAELLSQDVFPQFEVGLIHGRLKAAEKDGLMTRFAAGEIPILVSTTVIEVGIDVPNASVMVIEHAERFGLSQLHQLRGRIGRGAHASYCILMVSGNVSADSFQRLQIMRNSNDGFKIAEKDLEIRGPGEFVGTRQSGMPEFHFGNIVRDRKWLERARTDAQGMLEEYVSRQQGDTGRLLEELSQAWEKRYGLFQVG
ncbi:MAG: ATP-dependent DNA helicase RecG [Acidobacteriota bacterium]